MAVLHCRLLQHCPQQKQNHRGASTGTAARAALWQRVSAGCMHMTFCSLAGTGERLGAGQVMGHLEPPCLTVATDWKTCLVQGCS